MLRPMRTAEGLRNEAITRALDEAIGGKPARLQRELALASGLPGTRANLAVATAFATECAARGRAADRVLFDLATLSADLAPGATELEFLPLCGVLGLGMRASLDPKIRARALATLHDAAEDVRFRVRDAVPIALAHVGEAMGDALVRDLAGWTDGFFQASAALLALSDAKFLSTLTEPGAVLDRLDEAFALARDAPRSAARFGVPVFDRLARWAAVEAPELRAAVEASLRSSRLAGRYAAEIARVRAALEASAPVPRDPTILVHGTRRRGKKRGR
jgi:hypothetical protein